MWSFLNVGPTGVGTDHDKLLAQLETELKESQELVRLQQQLLQVQVSFVHAHTFSYELLIVSDLETHSLVSVCRIALPHLSPLNWLILTFWKSGNVFRCGGQSWIIRGGLLKGRGSPSPPLPSD